jgi:hypothetical protein
MLGVSVIKVSQRVVQNCAVFQQKNPRTIENDREKLSRLAASHSRYSRPDKHRIRMGGSNPHTDMDSRR